MRNTFLITCQQCVFSKPLLHARRHVSTSICMPHSK